MARARFPKFLILLVTVVALMPAGLAAQSMTLEERAQHLADKGSESLRQGEWVAACAHYMLANAYAANAYSENLSGILPLLSERERSACIVQARVTPGADPSFDATGTAVAPTEPAAGSTAAADPAPAAPEPSSPPPDPETQIAACVEKKMRSPSSISASIRRTMFELDCYVEVTGGVPQTD